MSARAPNPTRRWIGAILALQVGFAGALVAIDLGRALPGLIAPSRAPALTEPTSPGDQTRRYRPDRMPSRPGLPDTGDMPTRLLAERAGL